MERLSRNLNIQLGRAKKGIVGEPRAKMGKKVNLACYKVFAICIESTSSPGSGTTFTFFFVHCLRKREDIYLSLF